MLKKHRLPLSIISILTLVTWYKILFQNFMGEGYYYFGKEFFIGTGIFNYDIGARILFGLFSIFFKDTIFYYQLFELVSVICLACVFYFFAYAITENKKITLLSSVLFSVNFTGLFEMIAIGNYQFFVQRLFWFIILLPSFLFFVQYFKTGKKKQYIISLLLYFFSFFCARYTAFFLPLYITYIAGLVLITKRSFKRIMNYFLCLFLFGVITIFFLGGDARFGSSSFLKGQNIISFLIKNWNFVTEYSFRQLTVLTVPDSLALFILKRLNVSFKEGIHYFYIPVLFLYSACAIYVIKKEKKLRAITFSFLLFIPIAFVLNLFMRGDELNTIEGSSRYLFVPTIAFSLFWGMFLFRFFQAKRHGNLILVCFFVCWIFVNLTEISAAINKDQEQHEAAKKSVAYIKALSPKFANDSVVIVPSILSYYGSYYIAQYYGKSHTIIEPFFANWPHGLKRPFNPKKDYILEYNYDEKLVDNRTEGYENIINGRK